MSVDGRARSAAATRAALIEAAVSVIVEHGWQAASVRELASAAGVPAGSIHYHFGGREQLLIEAVGQQLQAMFATPASVIRTAGSIEDLLNGTVGWTSSPDISDRQRSLLLEAMAQARRDPAMSAALDAALTGFRHAVAGAFHRLGAPAVHGPGSVAQPGAAARSLAAAFTAHVNGLWLMSVVEAGFPIDDAAAEAIGIWRHRLTAAPRPAPSSIE